MKNFIQKSRLGFTLIELLIVIVIIGILSVAFLPTVLNAPKKARDNQKKAHLTTIAQAIQSYYSDLGDLSIAPEAFIEPKIANTFPNSTLPLDPKSQKPYKYKYDKTSKCFVLLTDSAMELKENGNTEQGDILKIKCADKASAFQSDNANNTYYMVILRMDQ